jgi:hypothetical protein
MSWLHSPFIRMLQIHLMFVLISNVSVGLSVSFARKRAGFNFLDSLTFLCSTVFTIQQVTDPSTSGNVTTESLVVP